MASFSLLEVLFKVQINPTHGSGASIQTNAAPTSTTGLTGFKVTDKLKSVKSITVWFDGDYPTQKQVKTIKVKYSDGKARIIGPQTGIPHSLKIDDHEKMTTLSMFAGDRVNRIFFVTDGGRVFRGWEKYHDFIGNSMLRCAFCGL
jgi:hypothetical protein